MLAGCWRVVGERSESEIETERDSSTDVLQHSFYNTHHQPQVVAFGHSDCVSMLGLFGVSMDDGGSGAGTLTVLDEGFLALNLFDSLEEGFARVHLGALVESTQDAGTASQIRVVFRIPRSQLSDLLVLAGGASLQHPTWARLPPQVDGMSFEADSHPYTRHHRMTN